MHAAWSSHRSYIINARILADSKLLYYAIQTLPCSADDTLMLHFCRLYFDFRAYK